MECVGLVACVGGLDGTYRVLVGKTEGKRQLGRPKHSWEDNIGIVIGIYFHSINLYKRCGNSHHNYNKIRKSYIDIEIVIIINISKI